MTALPSFYNFNDNRIRVAMIDSNPWFVATDVCNALGMSVYGGTSQWTRTVSDADKTNITKTQHPEIFSGSRAGSLTVLSEAGLYKLVMRSDKPEARAFQDWVTRDVLPAIRKDGAYVMGEEKVATGELSEEEFILKAVSILQAKVERLKEENKAQAKVIDQHLRFVTVDEFRSLNHLYLTHGEKIALGKAAVRHCDKHGLKVRKQQRTINRNSIYEREVTIREYPWDALVAASRSVGLPVSA